MNEHADQADEDGDELEFWYAQMFDAGFDQDQIEARLDSPAPLTPGEAQAWSVPLREWTVLYGDPLVSNEERGRTEERKDGPHGQHSE